MGDSLRLLPYGARAILMALPDAATRRTLTRWLGAQDLEGIDVVPAESTILLDLSDPSITDTDAHARLTRVAQGLRDLDLESLTAQPPSEVTPVTIEVRYDGPDLAATADSFGMSTEALVDWHTASPWIVEFLGFMPGFGYLTRADHQRPVPRLDSPRRAIPGGAVGLAGLYCGIYPRSSPGGWQLLGHTDHVLFDATGDGATLSPGGRVQFQEIRQPPHGATHDQP